MRLPDSHREILYGSAMGIPAGLVYAVLLWSFLSNVGASQNPATPALAQGRFPNMRPEESTCPVVPHQPLSLSDLTVLCWSRVR